MSEAAMWTRAAAWEAEGARVGIITCLKCGAAVLLDPRDPLNMKAIHERWHTEAAL